MKAEVGKNALLGKRIKIARCYRGFSLRQLGKLIGYSGMLVHKWETEKLSPSTQQLLK